MTAKVYSLEHPQFVVRPGTEPPETDKTVVLVSHGVLRKTRGFSLLPNPPSTRLETRGASMVLRPSDLEMVRRVLSRRAVIHVCEDGHTDPECEACQALAVVTSMCQAHGDR